MNEFYVKRAAINMSRTCYLGLLLLICNKITEANVRFVCPRPISPRSDEESVTYMTPSSCEKSDGSSKEDVLDISAGLFTVRFEETRFHPGSPFRILLVGASQHRSLKPSNGTNFTVSNEIIKQSCLLLDHIPHNNQAVISKDCMLKGNDYPLGVCNGSTYYVTIYIPDLACDDCSLMLQQIIPSPGNKLCDVTQLNDTGNATDCQMYTSCSRVRIRPSPDGIGRDLSFCSDYLKNMPGDWPYRPQDLFKTDQGASLTLDILHKNLHILVPSGLKLGPIERVEVRENTSIIWNVTVTEKHGNSDPVVVTWKNLSATEHEELSKNKLVLNVVGSEKSLAEDILYTGQHFTEGRLGALHEKYSDSGWLVSSKFLGPLAEDPIAAIPSGPCAPIGSYYMAYLQSVHVTAHGILGMTVLENRAYITAVLHVDREEIQTIKISGPELVDIPPIEINVTPSFNGVLMASVDISSQLPFINTVRFLKSVTIITDKEKDVLEGDLEEGMFAVLRDGRGQVQGMADLQFTQGQWLKVDIVLNDLSPKVLTALLLGPENSVLLDLSRETIHCTQAFCCLEAIAHEVTSELVLHLMKGQAIVRVTTEGGNVTGNVLGSPFGYCNLAGGACQELFYQFSMSGLGVEEMRNDGEMEEKRGWQETETYVLDRANILQYCVQVDNPAWSGKNYTLSLVTRDEQIDEVPFNPLQDFTHSFIACNNIPLDENSPLISSLAVNSHKPMTLVINDGLHKLVSQELPHISRGECIQSKIHVVGKDKSYWSPDSAPFQDIYAVVSDNLKFIFEKNSTLYLMASEKAYRNCDFSGAKLLPAMDTLGETAFYLHSITEAGKLYFSDGTLCNTSSPQKITVHVIGGASAMQDDRRDEWCRKSIYNVWRDEQLKTWEEPDVSGRILIGLLVGLASAGVFLAWQGVRIKRSTESFRGHSDNVFVRF
ncbi:unnamed protein product [Lymnaea stagnalis]|uniref:Uncharacterized protein n=1 Tax=Lymnaea stagnalis TaxID=6523 RepID=A0AAV2HJP3_LYMST